MVYRKHDQLKGFTIVELLVVIVVIGILASITIISYNGVSQKAYLASMQTGLDNGSKALQLFQIENTNYPLTIDCGQPESTTNHCVKLSSDVTYTYRTSASNPTFFCLEANKNSDYYHTTQKNTLISGPCPVLNLESRNTSSYPGSGTTWRDISGNDNDGVLTNGATYDTSSGGISFDGTDDYILVNNSASLSSNSMTLSMRIYIRDNPDCDGNNNWRSLIHKSSSESSASTGYDIVLEQDRRIAWDTGTGVTDRWWPTGLTIPMNTWTNLTVTYDESGNKKVYVDGVLHSTKTISSLPMSSNTNNLLISNPSVVCPNGSGGFPGLISDVLIYPKALSDEAIKAVYNSIK
jgi:prepilin-type N-terminal cleavage/methylation domain-containing protein